MIPTGYFGKIPGHGDFVARGTGSSTGRAFEQWLQMVNDKVAESGQPLPARPIGFMYRDPTGQSLLLGMFGPSRDKVGRVFPLALFGELPAAVMPLFPGLAGALTPFVQGLEQVCRRAAHLTPSELAAAIDAVPRPTLADIRQAAKRELDRLATIPVAVLLQRGLGTPEASYYALEVLLRACNSARHHGSVRNPVVLDVPAQSDVELTFWLACVQAATGAGLGPPSALWDAPAQRLLVALGAPDSNILHYLRRNNVPSQRLWPIHSASAESWQAARARLARSYIDLLETASASAQEFIFAIAELAEKSA